MVNTFNIELEVVNNWLYSSKLTLNLQKSHYIIFHRHKLTGNNLNATPLILNDCILENLQHTKFLGVTIQNNLKWNLHIKNISSKLNQLSGILYRIRDYLDRRSLKLFYNGLIYPQLSYANIIWGKTYQSHLKPLVTAQKRTIRTIMYRSRIHHTNNDFIELSFLKLSDINTYFGLIFVFKSLNNLVLPINYFTYATNPRYNLRNNLNLNVPFSNSDQGQTSPSYYCAELWNVTPSHIKNQPFVVSFKSSVKSYLMNRYLDTE